MTSETNLPVARATKPTKPRRISKKLNAAIGALLDGTAKTQTEAAAAAGIARETLSRALQRSDVQEHMRAQVEKQLKGKTLVRAAGKLDRLIDAQSENVAFRATELTLGLNGFQPPQRGTTINTSVSVGWMIDLRTDIAKPGGLSTEYGSVGGVIIDAEPGEQQEGDEDG